MQQSKGYMKIAAFLDVTPYRLVNKHRLFGEACHLHFQGRTLPHFSSSNTRLHVLNNLEYLT
jgi:hypothetical protein